MMNEASTDVCPVVGGFSVKVSRDIAVIEKNVDIKKGYRCE